MRKLELTEVPDINNLRVIYTCDSIPLHGVVLRYEDGQPRIGFVVATNGEPVDHNITSETVAVIQYTRSVNPDLYRLASMLVSRAHDYIQEPELRYFLCNAPDVNVYILEHSNESKPETS